MAAEDRETKVRGHLGRQDTKFLAIKTIITTGMQQIADIIPEFGFMVIEE